MTILPPIATLIPKPIPLWRHAWSVSPTSAAFAGLSRFDSVLTCVTRLGAEELRLFLVEVAVHHVLESTRSLCIAK